MPDRANTIIYGKRLRRLRYSKDLSKAELAEKANVPEKTLQTIEYEDQTSIEKGVVARIARALKVKTDVLTRPPVSIAKKAKAQFPKRVQKPLSKTVILRSKKQVLFYSKLIIYSLEDALRATEERRYHNNPPSDLIIDDDNFVQEVRNLVVELKRLNDILQTTRNLRGAAKKPVIEVKKHVNVFLKKWAATVGVERASLQLEPWWRCCIKWALVTPCSTN